MASRFSFVLLSFLLLMGPFSFAKDNLFAGKITDENGNAIPGALIKVSKNGVQLKNLSDSETTILVYDKEQLLKPNGELLVEV